MHISTPWYIPVLMVLGILSLAGAGACLILYFLVTNEYDRIVYLAGFFVFLVTSFFSLGMSKVTHMLFRTNTHR